LLSVSLPLLVGLLLFCLPVALGCEVNRSARGLAACLQIRP